jgi:hypothetical protein
MAALVIKAHIAADGGHLHNGRVAPPEPQESKMTGFGFHFSDRLNRSNLLVATVLALVTIVSSPSARAQTFQINPGMTVQLLNAERIVTIQQTNGLRFVDAWDDGTNDWTVVTRNFQNDDSQKWRMTQVSGNVYTFQQLSSGRFLDAHETGAPGYDFRMVTRPMQGNASQQWRLVDYGGAFYTMENVLLSQFADNTLESALDFHLMTGPQAQGSNSQTWRIVDSN